MSRTPKFELKKDNVLHLMEQNGLLQVDVAELSGLDKATISKALSSGTATRRVIGKIAKGLDVEARYIAIFPRNKKTAEAATPAADENIVPTKNNNNVTTTEAVCQNEDRLYFYDGEWRTEKRIYELVTIDKLVELLNLPVIAITRVR